MSDTLKEDQNLQRKPPEMEDFWRGKELTPSELDKVARLKYALDYSAAKYLHKIRTEYLKEHPDATLPDLPDYLKLENYPQED